MKKLTEEQKSEYIGLLEYVIEEYPNDKKQKESIMTNIKKEKMMKIIIKKNKSGRVKISQFSMDMIKKFFHNPYERKEFVRYVSQLIIDKDLPRMEFHMEDRGKVSNQEFDKLINETKKENSWVVRHSFPKV